MTFIALAGVIAEGATAALVGTGLGTAAGVGAGAAGAGLMGAGATAGLASGIGAVGAGALGGAGLGALGSAVTGGDVGKGALYGALGGGLSGGLSSAIGSIGGAAATPGAGALGSTGGTAAGAAPGSAAGSAAGSTGGTAAGAGAGGAGGAGSSLAGVAPGGGAFVGPQVPVNLVTSQTGGIAPGSVINAMGGASNIPTGAVPASSGIGAVGNTVVAPTGLPAGTYANTLFGQHPLMAIGAGSMLGSYLGGDSGPTQATPPNQAWNPLSFYKFNPRKFKSQPAGYTGYLYANSDYQQPTFAAGGITSLGGRFGQPSMMQRPMMQRPMMQRPMQMPPMAQRPMQMPPMMQRPMQMPEAQPMQTKPMQMAGPMSFGGGNGPVTTSEGFTALADGGIASLNPNPSMMQGGPAEVNFMGQDAYPTSQQKLSFYASPTQMPTSAQQAMASYEPATNPLTGEPSKHFAGGGLLGGIPGARAIGDWAARNSIYGFDDATQIPVVGTTLYGQPTQYDSMGKPYAAGGMSNLGHYSDGGNLTRGPGDGVSDDIPATIAGKQPARLADGEFVVPARAVSELGNGSTEAGAKRLYAMVDQIQNKRRKSMGKKNIAVDSKARAALPV